MKTLLFTILITMLTLSAFSIELKGTVSTSDDINTFLKSKGKFFRFIGDDEYLMPDIDFMKEMIKNIKVNLEVYTRQANPDCDDLSLFLHSEIKKLSFNKSWTKSLAFGEIVIQRKYDKHSLNFFITDTKRFYLVDSETFEIYELDRNSKLLFLRM